MDELLKAIEELKRAYKASGVGSVLIDLDEYNERVEIYDNERNEIKYEKPAIKNGEWLRGLSDEELVEYLNYKVCDHVSCLMCDMFFADLKYREKHKEDKCRKEHLGCRIEWLRAEHKEVEE